MTSINYSKIDPQKYYRDVLAHGIRPDGRSLTEFRPMSINVKSLHNADGSAIVKIGNTTVVCGVKAELAKPKSETPYEGYLIPNVELPPLCSSQYHPGAPSDEAQAAARFLDETLQNCNCVDLRDLCIVPDVLAWVLHVDTICLNQDGGLLNACVAAAVAALKTVTLPEVIYDLEKKEKTVNINNRKSLEVKSCPVATTFAIFDSNNILNDPTIEEEMLSTGLVTIVVRAETGDICGIHQPGSDSLSAEDLDNCIVAAQKKTKSVAELLNVAMSSPER